MACKEKLSGLAVTGVVASFQPETDDPSLSSYISPGNRLRRMYEYNIRLARREAASSLKHIGPTGRSAGEREGERSGKESCADDALHSSYMDEPHH